MKYKTAAVITAVFISLCVTGCRNEINSPKTVLLRVISQAQKGNWEEAYKYVTPDLYNLMQNLRSDIAVGVYASKKQRKVTETVNGDTAYVSVYFKNEENPVTFYFKKDNGKWKIDAPFAKTEEGIPLVEIIPYIEDGDIILCGEDHLSSYYIRSLSQTDKRFSHSGIIYKKKGTLSVISAEGLEDKYRNKKSEVMERPIEEYIKGKNIIGIYRAKSKNRKMFSGKAREYLGIPFDFKYTLDNEEKLYCTQFIQIVLRETNTPVKLRKTYLRREGKDIILPDSISSSDDFEEIRYIEMGSRVW